VIGRALTPGNATGAVLKLDVPLSFWGGVDLHSGAIIDQSHPRLGAGIAGRVLAMPHARGSSSSSSALMELARAGIAPVAIVMQRHDPILVIGSLVAAELYGIEIPIVLLGEADWHGLREGDVVHIAVSGEEATLRPA
jgi:predicted aconitase with swiveling domain